jgi:hypothetical protein
MLRLGALAALGKRHCAIGGAMNLRGFNGKTRTTILLTLAPLGLQQTFDD